MSICISDWWTYKIDSRDRPLDFFFFFSNNIVLADKIKSRINVKLKIWWYALKSKWFGLSKTKIEYMECKFSKSINKNKGTVRLDGQ